MLASCQPLTKAGSGSESGSVCQWYGSADLDPYQNVAGPQPCFIETVPSSPVISSPFLHKTIFFSKILKAHMMKFSGKKLSKLKT